MVRIDTLEMPTFHILILILMEVRQDSISFLFLKNRLMIWGSYKKMCSKKGEDIFDRKEWGQYLYHKLLIKF